MDGWYYTLLAGAAITVFSKMSNNLKGKITLIGDD